MDTLPSHPLNTIPEMVSVDSLKAWDKNPRSMSEKAFENLQRSIDKYGLSQPILANKKDGRIIGGHQRWRSARSLGMKEVPVIWYDLSPADQAEFNILLNDPKFQGEQDDQLLAELLQTELDVENIQFLDYSDEDIAKLQDGWAAEEADKLLNEKGDKAKRYTLEDLEQLRQVYESKGGNPNTASFLAELRMVEHGSHQG